MDQTDSLTYIGAVLVGVVALGIDSVLGVQNGIGPALLLSVASIASFMFIGRTDHI